MPMCLPPPPDSLQSRPGVFASIRLISSAGIDADGRFDWKQIAAGLNQAVDGFGNAGSICIATRCILIAIDFNVIAIHSGDLYYRRKREGGGEGGRGRWMDCKI